MAPIRVGFRGISANVGPRTDAGGWAKAAHLPYLRKSSLYEIVALCNTSVETAKAAIRSHGLPELTKAYGSPEGLAADLDVDLVVCSVNVQKHYNLIKPALLAGKDVIVEWPLGANLKEAEELTLIAKETGAKTAVGLQARFAPAVTKVRELLAEGRIEPVLSSTFVGAVGLYSGIESVGAGFLMDINTGGNMVTIHCGHDKNRRLPPSTGYTY
ncbi:hypothetical protein H2201_001501 [Coniosporium apollinis]|uniref:Gfo/Idh/MocA-like oxidoreductase N-terminal domain-containing protein n=1 Tax=Coniosporium apollinis TaxID=61459 RepID=A0ABQ9P6E7_9PEZI|nr:hypothetical protein H2201_001501 [Coniosporium apollinis]